MLSKSAACTLFFPSPRSVFLSVSPWPFPAAHHFPAADSTCGVRVRLRADCLICCCRAMAGGLQWISFIRPIRVEERSDGRQEGEKRDRRMGGGGDGAFAGKHTPGAVRSQHLNTHLLKAAIQLFTAKKMLLSPRSNPI